MLRPPPAPEAETVDARRAAAAESPLAETASADEAPLAPGDAQLYRNVAFGGAIPSGYKSNVLEPSLGNGGRYVFYTGNWFAARSIDGGSTWSYVNAYNNMSDFCCDQIAQYDKARDMYLWLRQGIANGSGVGRFRLGVSTNNGASFCNYDFYPTNTNSAWTGQWWDYPHIQLGADFAYIAYNMFNASDTWTRTVLLRFPLDALRNCAGFSYNYVASTSWFTFVPVQGACLLYTSPSPRDRTRSRMPSSA